MSHCGPAPSAQNFSCSPVLPSCVQKEEAGVAVHWRARMKQQRAEQKRAQRMERGAAHLVKLREEADMSRGIMAWAEEINMMCDVKMFPRVWIGLSSLRMGLSRKDQKTGDRRV